MDYFYGFVSRLNIISIYSLQKVKSKKPLFVITHISRLSCATRAPIKKSKFITPSYFEYVRGAGEETWPDNDKRISSQNPKVFHRLPCRLSYQIDEEWSLLVGIHTGSCGFPRLPFDIQTICSIFKKAKKRPFFSNAT